METSHASDPRDKFKTAARLTRLQIERVTWHLRRRLRGQAIWALVASTGAVGIVLTIYLMISGISAVGAAGEKQTTPEAAKSTGVKPGRSPVELQTKSSKGNVPTSRAEIQPIESAVIEPTEAETSRIQTTGGQIQPVATRDEPDAVFPERPTGSTDEFDDNPFSEFANRGNVTIKDDESSANLEIELVRIAPPVAEGAWTSTVDDDPQFQVTGKEITRNDPAESNPFAKAKPKAERTDSPGWTAFNDLRTFSAAPPVPKFELVEFSAEATTTTTVHALQIRFEVDVPDEVTVGRPFVIRYRITNIGKTAVTAISIYSDLPVELEHRFGRKLEKKIGRLAPGESHAARLNVRAVKAGTAKISARLIVAGLSLETAVRDTRVRSVAKP